VEDAKTGLDVVAAVREALSSHAAVRSVGLVGSRGEGRGHELSDWDFAVVTDDFERVARDLPALVSRLRPLAEQWDPYSSYECYMLMLRGPLKIDLIFADEKREWSGPWAVSESTLEAIDRHFWDWILWLEQKRRGGRDEVFETGLAQMHELLLSPMGVTRPPGSIAAAVKAYLDARDELEQRFGTRVLRALEREVRPVVQP
jgi:Nucleotidyltransferase domain